MNSQISSFHGILWNSLQRQKNELQKIIFEIENFEFTDIELQKHMNNEFNKMNREDAEKWILRDHFANRTTDVKVLIITLSSFYLEGLFNTYFALKTGNNKEFKSTISKISIGEKIIKMTFLDRILIGPQKYNPNYSVPENLANQLKALIKHRNFLAHNEPTITNGDETIFKGKSIEWDDTYKQMFEWTDLPQKIHENLNTYEKDLPENDYQLNMFSLYERYRFNSYLKEPHLEAIGARYLDK